MVKAKNVTFWSATLLAAGLLTARVATAQEAPPAAGPGVGAVAPSFSLPGATRYGLLRDPVNLADYRGKIVVLAFFFKARTKG
jgi:thioredoxin-dependent peroxiredoxin